MHRKVNLLFRRLLETYRRVDVLIACYAHLWYVRLGLVIVDRQMYAHTHIQYWSFLVVHALSHSLHIDAMLSKSVTYIPVSNKTMHCDHIGLFTFTSLP